jgi:hypothetical protein
MTLHHNPVDPKKNKLLQPFLNVANFEDWVAWVEQNGKVLLENANANYIPDDFAIKINFIDLRWEDSVSNSHCAPFGKSTNWGGTQTHRGVPRGYPGWRGRMEWTQFGKSVRPSGRPTRPYPKRDLFDSFNGVWDNTPVHTGSGNGGGAWEQGQYEISLFQEEWPGLSAMHNAAYREWEINAVIEGLHARRQCKYAYEFRHGKSAWDR